MMSWRLHQQSKPWPSPNPVFLDNQTGEDPPAWGYTEGYTHSEGQVLDGTVYKNAFPIPGEHYIYKAKKKDKYAKSKARFEQKEKLPPIREAQSEASSKAGSTRSNGSWVIARYNPDILADVLASSDSDSENEDYTSGREERKSRKGSRGKQKTSLRHVDVIRNIQSSGTKAQPKRQNVDSQRFHAKDTNQQRDNLHRSSLNGDALLANQLMNNGLLYKERHPLGMTAGDDKLVNVNPVEDYSWINTAPLEQEPSGSSDFGRRQSIRKSQASHSSRRNCWIAGVVVVLTVLLIAAGITTYLLVQRSSSSEEEETPISTTVPSNFPTVTFGVVLSLDKGSYSSSLEDKQSSDFILLQMEVCNFLESDIKMRLYLEIYDCDVERFGNGSIRVFVNLLFSEERMTSFRTLNQGVSEEGIIAFIKEDIGAGMANPSNETSNEFVLRFQPRIVLEEMTSLSPTSATTETSSSTTSPTTTTTTIAQTTTSEMQETTTTTESNLNVTTISQSTLTPVDGANQTSSVQTQNATTTSEPSSAS